MTTMLGRLKQVEMDGLLIEEALELSAFAKVVRAEFETNKIPVPDWFDDVQRKLNEDIASKRRDAIQKRLKEIGATRTQLMTAAEKRDALDKEQAELEAALAQK